jgi:hypothetical protein
VALRLTGLTNLLNEVASASNNASSLWPVYSRGLPLEPTAEPAWLIHTTISLVKQTAVLVVETQNPRVFRSRVSLSLSRRVH